MKTMIRRFMPALAVVLAALALVSCGATGQLSKMKKLAGAGDYAALAAIQVNCTAEQAGCNQQYLLKGDANYRLAQAAVLQRTFPEAAAFFGAAAENLDKGIELTSSWDTNLGDRRTWTTNRLESSRRQRDLLANEPAAAANAQLLTAAEKYRRLDAGDSVPIYFVNNAKFYNLRPKILETDDPAALCAEVKALLVDLRQNLANTDETTRPMYEELTASITGILPAIDGCTE